MRPQRLSVSLRAVRCFFEGQLCECTQEDLQGSEEKPQEDEEEEEGHQEMKAQGRQERKAQGEQETKAPE